MSSFGQETLIMFVCIASCLGALAIFFVPEKAKNLVAMPGAIAVVIFMALQIAISTLLGLFTAFEASNFMGVYVTGAYRLHANEVFAAVAGLYVITLIAAYYRCRFAYPIGKSLFLGLAICLGMCSIAWPFAFKELQVSSSVQYGSY